MSSTRNLLRLVQEDCYGRILAHSWFSDIAVVLERRALPVREIEKLLGTLKGRGGKVGAAILVQRPVYFPEADNSAGLGQLIQAFTVIEHPSLNAGDLGTGKAAEDIATELFNLFHQAASSMPSQAFDAPPGGSIVPDDSFDGFNAWETRLRLLTAPGRDERAGQPLFVPDGGSGLAAVPITSATAAAEIYYTLDGTYPRNGNGTLYSVPFAPGAGVTLRAVAYKAGYQASNLTQSAFT